jgi:predicted DNA-binding antitoxin AbrB/MazE fold protein
MSITIEAFYEAGILKPLTPLTTLKDKTKVRVTIEPAEKPVPRVRRVAPMPDYSQAREWLHQHREELRGQWVVMDTEKLIGHTHDPDTLKAIFDQARANGVEAPFVHRVPLDDEPIWPGIL